MTSNRPPVGVAEDALWRDRLKLEAGSEAWHASPRAKRLYTTPEMRMQQTKRYGDPNKFSHMGFQGTTMAAWFKKLDSPRNQQESIRKMRNELGMRNDVVTLWDERTLERAMDKWTHRNERILAGQTSPRRANETPRTPREERTIRFGDGFEMPMVSARSKIMEEGQLKVPWRRHDDVALTTALANRAPRARGTF